MKKPFPAYRGSDPYVFVSYAHADGTLVSDELVWLHESGVNVWYDEGIEPGTEWREELAQAIRNADLFVFLATPLAVASEHCRKEINFALDIGCPVLTLYLAETELPDGLRLALSDRQAILKAQFHEAAYRKKVLDSISVSLPSADAAVAPELSPRNRKTGLVMTAIAALLVATAAGLWRFLPGEERVETMPVAVEELARPPLQKSIAVLPFKNLSNDPDQEYFSEGLSEDILNGLARTSGLRVMAKATSFRFRENIDPVAIGAQLGVTHLLEGSVRRSGDRVRISLQLATTEDGTQIWSNQFDREYTDVFRLQDEITNSVLSILQLRLREDGVGPSYQTQSVNAYNAFLMARYHFQRLEFRQAIEQAQLAVALDREYAKAHVMLASIKTFMVWWSVVEPTVFLDEIDGHLDDALALDPSNIEAITERQLGEFLLSRDFQKGLNEVAALLALHPNEESVVMTYATMLQTLGEVDLAADLTRHALSFDPLSPAGHRQLAEQLLYAGRFAEARAAALEAERLGLNVALMFARIAASEGDLDALKRQLARPANDWVNGQRWIPAFQVTLTELDEGPKAAISQLEALLRDDPDNGEYRQYLENLRGNWAVTVDLVASRIRAGHFHTIRNANSTEGRFRYPEYYSSDVYQSMLAEFGMDKASLSKVEIPPMPIDISRR